MTEAPFAYGLAGIEFRNVDGVGSYFEMTDTQIDVLVYWDESLGKWFVRINGQEWTLFEDSNGRSHVRALNEGATFLFRELLEFAEQSWSM